MLLSHFLIASNTRAGKSHRLYIFPSIYAFRIYTYLLLLTYAFCICKSVISFLHTPNYDGLKGDSLCTRQTTHLSEDTFPIL